MNNTLKKQKQPILTAIIMAQIIVVLSLFMELLGIQSKAIISLLKYFFMTIATFIMLRGVVRNHLKPNVIQFFFFFWLVYLYVSAIPDIISPYRNYVNIKRFLTYILFTYSLPCLMIADLDIGFWRQLLRLSYSLLWIYLLTVITFNGMRVENCTFLAEGVIILIMTWSYHVSKKRFVIALVLSLVVVGMMLSARRNRVVFFGGGFIFALVINVLQNNSYTRTRKITLVLLSLAMGIGLFLFGDHFSDFFNKMNTGMSSREHVIEDFVDDFNYHPSDWVYGRGLYGQFDAGNLNTDDDLGLRDGIENGYLFLILKGGGIWLGLLTLIAINAIFNGLFKSKNLLCKAFAMIILLYYLDMIGYGIPQTSLKYIMVFIAIAGCNTPWLRDCSDEYLAKEIGLK